MKVAVHVHLFCELVSWEFRHHLVIVSVDILTGLIRQTISFKILSG